MITSVNMSSGLIRIADTTKARLLAQSLTFDADGKPNEPMDSIIRRGVILLEQKAQVTKIDISQL
jgi:hypothetical protein